jgi:hypothetical protein
MNTFNIRDIYSQGEHVYIWTIVWRGNEISGSAGTVRQAYRHARKAVKRYQKMWRFLNPNE